MYKITLKIEKGDTGSAIDQNDEQQSVQTDLTVNGTLLSVEGYAVVKLVLQKVEAMLKAQH